MCVCNILTECLEQGSRLTVLGKARDSLEETSSKIQGVVRERLFRWFSVSDLEEILDSNSADLDLMKKAFAEECVALISVG